MQIRLAGGRGDKAQGQHGQKRGWSTGENSRQWPGAKDGGGL